MSDDNDSGTARTNFVAADSPMGLASYWVVFIWAVYVHPSAMTTVRYTCVARTAELPLHITASTGTGVRRRR